jgi:hypothetical protein
MMAWPLPEKYNTVYLEKMILQSKVDNPTWPWDSSNKDLWNVLSSTERFTLLEEKGVKDCLDRRRRSEPIEHTIQHLPCHSEDANAMEDNPNTAYALNPTDQPPTPPAPSLRIHPTSTPPAETPVPSQTSPCHATNLLLSQTHAPHPSTETSGTGHYSL